MNGTAIENDAGTFARSILERGSNDPFVGAGIDAALLVTEEAFELLEEITATELDDEELSGTVPDVSDEQPVSSNTATRGRERCERIERKAYCQTNLLAIRLITKAQCRFLTSKCV